MHRLHILAVLLLFGWVAAPNLVATAQNNDEADDYYAGLPHGYCDPLADDVDFRTPVFSEAVQEDDQQLGPDTWVAWGLLVNSDAEVFLIRVASGDLDAVRELAGSADPSLPEPLPVKSACLDLVPADYESFGDPPEGEPSPPALDLNGDGELDPPDRDFDGDGQPDLIDDPAFEGTVLPGADVPLAFSANDRIIGFGAIGYFGAPFDEDANQAEVAETASEIVLDLVESGELVSNWIGVLEDTDRFTSITSGNPTPDELPEDSDYLLSYTFDPSLRSGYTDGWQLCALSVYASIAILSGWLTGTLYQRTAPKDYWSPFSASTSFLDCFTVRIVGQSSTSYYAFYGSGWSWIW